MNSLKTKVGLKPRFSLQSQVLPTVPGEMGGWKHQTVKDDATYQGSVGRSNDKLDNTQSIMATSTNILHIIITMARLLDRTFSQQNGMCQIRDDVLCLMTSTFNLMRLRVAYGMHQCPTWWPSTRSSQEETSPQPDVTRRYGPVSLRHMITYFLCGWSKLNQLKC